MIGFGDFVDAVFAAIARRQDRAFRLEVAHCGDGSHANERTKHITREFHIVRQRTNRHRAILASHQPYAIEPRIERMDDNV